jgi:hypothetical protein
VHASLASVFFLCPVFKSRLFRILFLLFAATTNDEDEVIINHLNAELNPIRHLLALVGARHIVHVSRIRVNPLNAELNPIRHLLALVGPRHIVHVSGIRVNQQVKGFFFFEGVASLPLYITCPNKHTAVLCHTYRP